MGHQQPTWSPDGKRIAFTRITPRFRGIATMPADGGPIKQATTGLDSYPSWSPDGTRLAFLRLLGSERECRGQTDVYVKRLGTKTARPVTMTSKPEHGSLSWSPDGRQLAFARTAFYGYAIVVARLNGTGEVPVTSGDRLDWGAAFSPDGRHIAFRRDGDIFLVAADGQGLRLLVQGARTYEPTWSPDGSRLAFFREDGIYVVNADGSGTRRLMSEGQYPEWSPDGRRIAYSLRGEIYVAAADGTGARSVSAGRR